MWELRLQGSGGIVGDEMGLGKTVQVSAFLGSMCRMRKIDGVLIVAPATMLRHWMNELEVWAPGVRRVLVHSSGEEKGGFKKGRGEVAGILRHLERWLGKRRKIREEEGEEGEADLKTGQAFAVVTTYDNVRLADKPLLNYPWSYAILDEGQKIRNPDAEVTLKCKSLRTVNRLLLSGTPIQNNLRELWSLFDFVFPGRLGTLPVFESEFAEPIKVGGYLNASPMQVQLAYRCALVLKDLINPFLLRRQKKDIPEVSLMPGKTEQVLFCRLSERQRELYEGYLRSREVLDSIEGRARCFKAIGVLRKLCNHPDLICPPGEDSKKQFVRGGGAGFIKDGEEGEEGELGGLDEGIGGEGGADEFITQLVQSSGKFQILDQILPLWKKQGHKVLIFSQTKLALNIIEKLVRARSMTYRRMDGSTSVSARQNMVDRFNGDDSIFLMLLTTKTGGVGVNLTGANRIVLFDPDWNPQTDRQANERAWR